MGLFDLCKKKSPEDLIRRKLSEAFDDAVMEVSTEASNMGPMFGGLYVQSVIGNLYQSLKNSEELEAACILYKLDYQSILDEECKRAIHKYLKY